MQSEVRHTKKKKKLDIKNLNYIYNYTSHSVLVFQESVSFLCSIIAINFMDRNNYRSTR
jgi:hypothetical protein